MKATEVIGVYGNRAREAASGASGRGSEHSRKRRLDEAFAAARSGAAMEKSDADEARGSGGGRRGDQGRRRRGPPSSACRLGWNETTTARGRGTMPRTDECPDAGNEKRGRRRDIASVGEGLRRWAPAICERDANEGALSARGADLDVEAGKAKEQLGPGQVGDTYAVVALSIFAIIVASARVVRRRAGGRRLAEQGLGAGQGAVDVDGSEQTGVPDLDEADGQTVLQEPADEFQRRQRRGLAAAGLEDDRGVVISPGLARSIAWAWNLDWPLTWADDAARYTTSVLPDEVIAALRMCARNQTLALTGEEAVIRRAIADLKTPLPPARDAASAVP
jgi:hypothetical protein